MKNERQIKEDVNGRLHSLDQNIRTVEKRLRAVERRLSLDVPSEDSIPEYEDHHDKALERINEDLASMRLQIDQLIQDSSNDMELKTNVLSLEAEISDLRSEIKVLREDNARLTELEDLQACSNAEQQRIEPLVHQMKAEISDLKAGLKRAEGQNRINIGSFSVPIELSGIAGAAMLVLTGILILYGRWDIIRSAYFSFAIAFVFAIAVMLKFYLVNSKRT